jgi:hypothetical protein
MNGPRNFGLPFRTGAYVGGNGRRLEIAPESAGEVALSTGSLVVRDPYDLVQGSPESERFDVEILPGRYPVSLLIADFGGNSRTPTWRGVAAAEIVLERASTVSWELAARPGWEVPDPTGQHTIVGFGVDSGSACILDASSLSFLNQLQQDALDLDRTVSEIAPSQGWATIENLATGANIVVLTCGMGDGLYPTWLGRSEHGSVTSLVIDLELLSHLEGPI